MLGKIFWSGSMPVEDFTVTFIHRGAVSDKKTIPFSSILKISRACFTYRSNGEEILIPLHRVLEVKNTKTGVSLWRKPSRVNTCSATRDRKVRRTF
ncbi:MAG: RNA repair domain-containing protein [Candidatus Bathyarchaeia archaeon]